MQIPSAIGHKLIVRPDVPDTTTASGLILPDDRDVVATSGEVVSIGPDGSEQNYRARQEAIRDCLKLVQEHEAEWNFPASLQVTREDMARLLRTAPDCDVKVGDRVVFPAECGLNMTVDGERYVILNIDDVCVVMSEEEAA